MTAGADNDSEKDETPNLAADRNSRNVEPCAVRAGSSCAGGPIYPVQLRADGAPLDFAEAFPRAKNWLKRMAPRP